MIAEDSPQGETYGGSLWPGRGRPGSWVVNPLADFSFFLKVGFFIIVWLYEAGETEKEHPGDQSPITYEQTTTQQTTP